MSCIYKVVREFRIDDNAGLQRAIDFAIKNQSSKIFCIYSQSNIGDWRNENNISKKVLDFLSQQIKEFENEIFEFSKILKNKHNIDLEFLILKTNNSVESIFNFAKENNVNKIFTDYTPMKEQRNFFIKFKNKNSKIEIEEIDSRNILPIINVSHKEESSAATFRRKWVRLLKSNIEMLDNAAHIFLNNKREDGFTFSKSYLKVHSEAYKIFEDFLENKIENYFENRNNAILDGQSHLSAFINLGRISRKYMLLRILKKFNLKVEDIFSENKNGSTLHNRDNFSESRLLLSIRAFVEEFIIRYELAENYCYYNQNYDNFNGLKDWAKNTLQKAKSDKREYVYKKEQFENSETHDSLWNACQNDLKHSGRLNGYLRMYWCKKILEWSENADDAITAAIYLNNKYSLDGYAPPSYVGILWSIGGLHDRAWFPRPIFGNIRYMARSGAEKKMNVNEYIKIFK